MTRHCAFAGIYCLEIIPGAQSGLAIIQQSIPVEVRRAGEPPLQSRPFVPFEKKQLAQNESRSTRSKLFLTNERKQKKKKEKHAGMIRQNFTCGSIFVLLLNCSSEGSCIFFDHWKKVLWMRYYSTYVSYFHYPPQSLWLTEIDHTKAQVFKKTYWMLRNLVDDFHRMSKILHMPSCATFCCNKERLQREEKFPAQWCITRPPHTLPPPPPRRRQHLRTTIPPSHPLQPRGCRPPPLRFAPSTSSSSSTSTMLCSSMARQFKSSKNLFRA